MNRRALNLTEEYDPLSLGWACWFDMLNPGAFCVDPVFMNQIHDMIDLSGNVHHISQAIAGQQPAIDTTTWPGKRTAIFNGSNNFMENDTFVIGPYPITIVFVASYADSLGTEACLGFGSSISNTEYNYGGKFLDSAATRVQSGASAQSAITVLDYTENEPFFAVAEIIDDDTRVIRVNRSNEDIDTGTEDFPAQSNRLCLGKRPGDGTSNEMNGNFGCGGIINRLLTASELDDLFDYCKSRYNIV